MTLCPYCFFKSVLAMTKGTVFIPDTSVTPPLTTRLRVQHLRSDAEPVQSEFTVFVSPAGWEAGDIDINKAWHCCGVVPRDGSDVNAQRFSKRHRTLDCP